MKCTFFERDNIIFSKFSWVLTSALFFSFPHQPADLLGFESTPRFGHHDTHKQLNTHAMNALDAMFGLSSPYPDIAQFQKYIVDGGSTEGLIWSPGAHKNPQNTITWWYGNDFRWQLDAAQQYNARNFVQAYRELGYAVHLAEDAQDPPHQTVTYHGLCSSYALKPNYNGDAELAPPKPCNIFTNPIIIDQFETYVGSAYAAGTISDGVNSSAVWQNQFNDSNSCPWYFWLSSTTAGSSTFWGDYGQGITPSCVNKPYNQRTDWFSQADPTDQKNVAQPQLYQALQNALNYMVAFSTSMPPFLSNVSASGGPLGGGSTITINFHAMENRTQIITSSATVWNTNGTPKTDGGNQVKAPDHTFALSPGTTLPWEADKSFSWDGTPADGATLSEGSYFLCLQVTDGDGNPSLTAGPNTTPGACAKFSIDKSSPTIVLKNQDDDYYSGSFDALIAVASDSGSGICGMSLSGYVSYGPASFNGPPSAAIGPFFILPPGDYSVSANDCAGNTTTLPFTVDDWIYTNTAVDSTSHSSSGEASVDLSMMTSDVMDILVAGDECYDNGVDINTCPNICSAITTSCGSCTNDSLGDYFYTAWVWCHHDSPENASLTVTNNSTDPYFHPTGDYIAINAYVHPPGSDYWEGVSASADGAYDKTPLDVTVTFPTFPSWSSIIRPISSADDIASVNTFYTGTSISSQTITPQMTTGLSSLARQPLGAIYTFQGPQFIYSSTTTISFSTTQPVGVSIDTTTLAIYRFDGVAWSSGAVTNQFVSVSSTGVIIATGTFTQSGSYALAFAAYDSSAPVTTFSIQGSSSSFDGTIFVSSSAYAVLRSTDPLVNGYASGVAAIIYRLDLIGPTTPWSIYTSSFSLPSGAHTLQYRSQDWAGNLETINSSTFMVTSGAVFKNPGNFTTPGKFLAGYLTYSSSPVNQIEVLSQPQNNYTLLVSSPDATPLMSITNIGNAGIGTSNPLVTVDIQGTSSSGDIALQLRSGNSTSTSSIQGAFCYDGTTSMCHALTTQHNSGSDLGNRMDFYLWNSAVTTGTVANTDVLALQAITAIGGQGAVHVMPVGAPNVELEVSNGSCTGCGTIHRIAAGQPSSRERKSDIRYLSDIEAVQAYKDVISLKHASYRYKRMAKSGALIPDPNQPLREGLIYEDSPRSIQGTAKSIVIDERVVNLELALQEAIKKFEKLQKRLKELQQ